jgi:hypothetical protein
VPANNKLFRPVPAILDNVAACGLAGRVVIRLAASRQDLYDRKAAFESIAESADTGSIFQPEELHMSGLKLFERAR